MAFYERHRARHNPNEIKMKPDLIPDDDPIFEACKRGDLSYVENKLRGGYSVESNGETSLSLMGYAIARGDLELANILINNGLKPDEKRNKFGQTYLMIAGVTRPLNIEILSLLLEAGADIEAKDKYGVTPLLQASGGPNKELLQFLINKGASVHAKSNRGQTTFWYAAQAGRIANLEALYAAGAREHGADGDGHTPLIRASFHGFLDVCSWLLAHGADKNAKDWRKKTAIDYAREQGYSEIVVLLERTNGVRLGDLI